MYRKITISFLILNLLCISALAQEKKIIKKKDDTKNIAIFNLNSNEISKKYNYYASIIPHTIGKNLQKNREYIVIRNYQKANKIKGYKDRREVQNFIEKVKQYGLDNKELNYIIIGEINTIEKIDEGKNKLNKLKEILITIQIIDVKSKRAINFVERSEEVGAIFQNTVDKLSKKINDSLDALNKESTFSAVMKFHNLMAKVNVGIKGGRAFLIGDYKGKYDDAVIISPYILVHPIKWIGISANFDYFSTSGDNDILKEDKGLIIYDSYFAFHGIIPIKFLDISLSGGIGVTYTRIHVESSLTPGNPFSKLNSNKERTDYSINAELSINFNISILRLSLGTAYKAIFYKGDQLQVINTFMGLGFRF